MSDLEEIAKAVIFPLIKWQNTEVRILIAYEYERYISHNTPLDETIAGPLKAIRINESDKSTNISNYTIWIRADHVEIELNYFRLFLTKPRLNSRGIPELYQNPLLLSWDDAQLTEKIEQYICQ